MRGYDCRSEAESSQHARYGSKLFLVRFSKSLCGHHGLDVSGFSRETDHDRWTSFSQSQGTKSIRQRMCQKIFSQAKARIVPKIFLPAMARILHEGISKYRIFNPFNWILKSGKNADSLRATNEVSGIISIQEVCQNLLAHRLNEMNWKLTPYFYFKGSSVLDSWRSNGEVMADSWMTHVLGPNSCYFNHLGHSSPSPLTF